MRWKAKEKPKLGDVRIRRIFSFKQRLCEDMHIHWLTWLYVLERYEEFIYEDAWEELTASKDKLDLIPHERRLKRKYVPEDKGNR